VEKDYFLMDKLMNLTKEFYIEEYNKITIMFYNFKENEKTEEIAPTKENLSVLLMNVI
jgi:hypothetical protein